MVPERCGTAKLFNLENKKMKTKTVIEYDETGKKIRETIYNEEESQNDLKSNQENPPRSLDEIIEAEKDKIDDKTRTRLKDNVKLFYLKEKWKEHYDLVTRTNVITDKLEKLINTMIASSIIMILFIIFAAIFAYINNVN